MRQPTITAGYEPVDNSHNIQLKIPAGAIADTPDYVELPDLAVRYYPGFHTLGASPAANPTQCPDLRALLNVPEGSVTHTLLKLALSVAQLERASWEGNDRLEYQQGIEHG